MTDINAVIAKHKGYVHPTKEKYPNVSDESLKKYWFSADNTKFLEGAPNFEHDPRLYMGLAKEMMQDYAVHLIEDDDLLNHCELWDYPMEGEPFQVYQATGADIGTAICLAYMRLNGLE